MQKYITDKVIIILLALASTTTINAQEKETPLVEINGKDYSLEEFNYIFEKNNSISKEPLTKDEYLDLFVNYKLKVTEAVAQGMDTMPDFKKELQYYQNELAKPYLTDKKAVEEIAKEAYERMLEDVDVSHILIRVPKNPFPKDTLKAYNKIKEIRDKIVNGADFEQMALKYSEDPSARKNKGHLGYISVFQTVYPFETAAYTTPTGEISPIVRTSFGYHIVKVNGKRKSPGEIKVAHIMKVIPRNANKEMQDKAKNEIDSIYVLLQNGEDFATLAEKFSDDRNSARNGGELKWFGTGRMIPEFAEAAFAIPENGKYSKPVRTRVGWHIIKRIDKRDIKPYDEQKEDLIKKVSNSQRALSGKTATIKRLKTENGFEVDSATVDYLKDIFAAKDFTKDDLLKKLENYKEPLCHIGDTTLHLKDFSSYLNKRNVLKADISPIVIDKQLNDFFNDNIINWERTHLAEKYPEFRYLINEYHDGLLIFNISQKEIWNKASNDSTGLKKYYDGHKNKYATSETFKGDLFFCKNNKTAKRIKALIKDSVTQKDIDTLKVLLGDSFIHKSGIYEKGQSPLYDVVLWNIKAKHKPDFPKNYSKTYFFGKFTESRIQDFEDVKGLVIADYQSFIEDKWIENLQEKYKPVIHKEVLKKSKK